MTRFTTTPPTPASSGPARPRYEYCPHGHRLRWQRRGGSDAPTKSAEAAPKGVITEQAAKKVVDTYEQVNNRANAKRDAKLLSTVETGQVHEQSKADYKQWETWSKKDQKEYTAPFYYKNREYLIPAADSGASWFAVQARSSEDPKGEGALIIFDKVDGTYKVTMAVYADEAPIPKIAVDKHGFVSPADPSAKVRHARPRPARRRLRGLLSKPVARRRLRRRSLRRRPRRGQSRSTRTVPTMTWRPSPLKYFAQTPAHPKVYALKLADGKTLALFPTAHTQELMLKQQYLSSHDITPTEDEVSTTRPNGTWSPTSSRAGRSPYWTPRASPRDRHRIPAGRLPVMGPTGPSREPYTAPQHWC
ncbi:hypothetical protein LV779_36285 [Streptomyces thinghirensis]|nr:hypothetical protein [Streptomyces thinghirensis]